MGCSVTSGFPGSLIGVTIDSVLKVPVSGVLVSSPCYVGLDILSASDGGFVYPLVPAGLYDFNFSKTGYETKSYPDYELFPNQTSFLKVELVQLPTGMSGTVKIKNADPGMAGAVIAGVTVKLLLNNVIISTQNSDNGLFSFQNLQPGNYEIVAKCRISTNIYKGSSALSLSAGDLITNIAILMSKQ